MWKQHPFHLLTVWVRALGRLCWEVFAQSVSNGYGQISVAALGISRLHWLGCPRWLLLLGTVDAGCWLVALLGYQQESL